MTNVGGESGKVHSTVRARWQARDPALVAGMKALGDLPIHALSCLRDGDVPGLAALVERNFSIRRELYGDAVVGTLNIAMVSLASSFGLSSKFTGSGGALICIQRDGQGW